MKIDRITLGETWNLGNYNSVKYELEATPDSNEDISEVFHNLRMRVEDSLTRIAQGKASATPEAKKL
jgi:hypothetical protein